MKPVAAAKEKKRSRVAPPAGLDEHDAALFTRLRSLRKRIADQHRLPPYIIFSDATLREMAQSRPTTPEEFRGISGVGDRKLEMYGAAFLEEIRK
jgi:ATP-dependent DNA helicase RecQ